MTPTNLYLITDIDGYTQIPVSMMNYVRWTTPAETEDLKIEHQDELNHRG